MQERGRDAVLDMAVDDRLGGFRLLIDGKADVVEDKVEALDPIRVVESFRDGGGVGTGLVVDGEFNLQPLGQTLSENLPLGFEIVKAAPGNEKDFQVILLSGCDGQICTHKKEAAQGEAAQYAAGAPAGPGENRFMAVAELHRLIDTTFPFAARKPS